MARDTGRSDDASDLLCRKGQASASRWRSYDHKDNFEPAQAATAPPSDAEEMGSWQKYDGAPPAPKRQAKTVSDDELPTSWSKYEEKPIASLLDSIENRRAKLRIALAESAVPTPPAHLATPTVVETAPKPDHPTAPAEPELTLVAEVPAIEVKPEPAASIEVDAPTSITDRPIEVAPAVATAPMAEPTAAAVPEPPLPPVDAPRLAATPAEDSEPELPTTSAPAPAELERSEPALPLEDPTATLAPSDEQVPALTEATAPEAFAVVTDEPRSDEPDTVSEVTEFADSTSDAVHEEPTVASAAPTPAFDAAPLPPHEPAAAASEPAIKARAPGKKAMLARLATMLEQALSAKRSPTVEPAPATVFVDEPAPAAEAPVEIASEAISHLTSDISKDRPAATIDVVGAGAPAADPTAVVEPEVSVAAPQEARVEVAVSHDDHGNHAAVETGADASIEAIDPAQAEPTAIDPIVDLRPIEPEAPLAASPEPDIELPTTLLDAIEIGEPSAPVEAQSSDFSLPPPSLDVSDEFVAPAEELSRVDEPETVTEAPVALAVETEPATYSVEPAEQHAGETDPGPAVAEVKKPDPARKATLTRLAEMLERALSARSASTALEPSAPSEGASVVPSSIVENVAPMPPGVQIPATVELSVEPETVEAPLALIEPAEIAEPAPVAGDVTVPEPVDATVEPHAGTGLPASENAAPETDLTIESVQEAAPRHQEIQIEELRDLEAAKTNEAPRGETDTTLALSDDFAEPAAGSADLTTPTGRDATAASIAADGAATADAPPEPTLEAVADHPAPPDVERELDDSAIAAERLEATTLADVSTPVEDTSTQAIVTAIDAAAAPPEEAHDGSDPVQAPALAASDPTSEPPVIVAAEIPAEYTVDVVPPLETAPPEQAPDVSDPVAAPTPTLDATPLVSESEAVEPETSDIVATPALAASDLTIETPEPAIIAAQIPAGPIADVVQPIETPPAEQEHNASEPLSAPSLDAAPIAPDPSALEPEASDAIDLSTLATPIPTIETPEPIIVAAEAPAEPIVHVVAPVEAAAAEISPAPDAAPVTAPPPLTPAQQEKAAREALTDDLAGVIHNVLSTTQFASRAMKPKRHDEEEPQADEPQPTDLAEELAASLPHPVAIPPRFGRMERGLAFVSVAAMLVVGYFAFSLWHGAGSPAARAAAPSPATAVVAPHSEDWGERARDMTRELNSIAVVRDAPSAQVPGPNTSARPQPSEAAQ